MRPRCLGGLREGHSWPQLLEVIPRGPEAPKLSEAQWRAGEVVGGVEQWVSGGRGSVLCLCRFGDVYLF